MLVEAGLITVSQLQEALRQQRFSGGRMGSNLVAMGILTEDALMDFLAQQTGVPRVDVKGLDIPQAVLERIPRRLAEQMVILPVALKEPKTLILAMADPSDLNALDAARFASGMTIEPLVAVHSALKLAIAEQYRRLEFGTLPVIMDVNDAYQARQDGLPVFLDSRGGTIPAPPVGRDHPGDPFFGDSRPQPKPEASGPFGFFPAPQPGESGIIHERSAKAEQIQPLDSYGTRALVLGLIKMLQRRGILGEDELQRLLNNLIEAREIDPNS